jgi:hypothetical protein
MMKNVLVYGNAHMAYRTESLLIAMCGERIRIFFFEFSNHQNKLAKVASRFLEWLCVMCQNVIRFDFWLLYHSKGQFMRGGKKCFFANKILLHPLSLIHKCVIIYHPVVIIN